MLSRLPKHPFARLLSVLLFALLLTPAVAAAQTDQGAAPAPAPFNNEQLEQIVAPIALYPDPLVAQILMASTYPLEVVQAARFAKANANLQGAQLDEELKKYTWDDSVKSLVSFPQVLTMMNEKLDWTQNLGDAFLGSQKGVMDAIQRLRAKAQAEGNLKSTAEQTVTVEPAPPAEAPPPGQQVIVQQAPAQVITIQPTNPQVVYVPTYNPTVVYGAWPYPAYPPYAYYPPGYVAGTALLSFGVGMAVGAALWGDCDWGHGDVNINNSNYNSFSNNVNRGDVNRGDGNRGDGNRGDRGDRGRPKDGGRDQWRHNPEHRKGAQYRDASTQQRFNKAGAGNVQSREAFRGRAAEGRQEMGRGGMQQGTLGGGRASQGAVGGGRAQAGQLGGGGQFGGGQAGRGQGGQLGGGGQFGGGQAARAPGAFDGVGQGRATSMDSARGQASRQSLQRGAGGGGFQRGGGGGSFQRGGGGGGGRGGGGRR